jgi:hypothetical protein
MQIVCGLAYEERIEPKGWKQKWRVRRKYFPTVSIEGRNNKLYPTTNANALAKFSQILGCAVIFYESKCDRQLGN